jgi:two-component system chemotaxis response regulator CheB
MKVIYGGSAGSFNVIASILKGLNKEVKIPIVIILHRLKVQKQYLKSTYNYSRIIQ